MAKNILLLFLSFVNPNGNTKFINLQNEEGTKNSNESSVRYLLENGGALDKIFIITSEKVCEPVPNYRDEEGNEVTHLQFFKARMEKFWSQSDYADCPYSEDSTDDEKLQRVAEIARDIQAYAARFKGEEIILHVDLTGGMRDVNIMMLDLTRLLHYSGLTVGKLLYSNRVDRKKDIGRVEELENIYDLFQLIAGVEEFVNFGSVNALEKYYEDKTCSEQLKRLRAAMKNFAEAIKLCHYWQFKKAVKKLHVAVRDFKPASDDAQDILMARLIGKIREDYHKLIVNFELVDDVEIIGWCLERDYLQQVLTLYTERIPEYLGEKKIIAQTEEEARKLTNKIEQDHLRNRFFYLVNVDTPHKDYLAKARKKFCSAVNSETVGKKNVDADEWLERLDKKLEPLYASVSDKPRLREQVQTFNAIRQTPDLLRDLNSSKLDPIREIINELSAELAAEDTTVYGRRKIIFSFVSRLPNEDFAKYFPAVVLDKNITGKCADKLRVMIREKIFYVTIPEEKFLSIMEKYFRIQRERNQSNHAYDEVQKGRKPDSDEFATAAELRKFISDAIEEIKEAVH